MNIFLKNYNLKKKCILITGAAGLLGKQFSRTIRGWRKSDFN